MGWHFPFALHSFGCFRVDWDHVTQSIIASSLFFCHNFCPNARAATPINRSGSKRGEGSYDGWMVGWVPTGWVYTRWAGVVQRCSWWVLITRQNRFIVVCASWCVYVCVCVCGCVCLYSVCFSFSLFCLLTWRMRNVPLSAVCICDNSVPIYARKWVVFTHLTGGES